MNTSKELFHWRVVAASVRGKSHEKVKQLCQDAHHWEMLSENVLVAAVADGAGSAKLGKVGAIIAAQTAVETVCLNGQTLLWNGATRDDEDWKFLLRRVLEATKTTVEAEAIACGVEARDLATTLIIVVATPKLVATAQVGDGAAVVGDMEGNLIALTAPQYGEYINETTFIISPDALETAQVSVWHGGAASIALFSDGLQMLALKAATGTPHRPFFSPLFKFMADITNETEAKDQLVAFLRSDQITNRADDDLTLLLATLS